MMLSLWKMKRDALEVHCFNPFYLFSTIIDLSSLVFSRAIIMTLSFLRMPLFSLPGELVLIFDRDLLLPLPPPNVGLIVSIRLKLGFNSELSNAYLTGYGDIGLINSLPSSNPSYPFLLTEQEDDFLLLFLDPLIGKLSPANSISSSLKLSESFDFSMYSNSPV